MKEEILRYLTFDQQFIKKMNSSTYLKSKDELYSILNWWNKLSKSETIGDLGQMNGNTPLIIIKIGSSSYYINADTNRAGVEVFLKNKINPWRLINNRDENGNTIVASFRPDEVASTSTANTKGLALKVFEYNYSSNQWDQKGQDIRPISLYSGSFIDQVFISEDGSIVSVYCHFLDEWSSSSLDRKGFLNRYSFINGYWVQLGSSVTHDLRSNSGFSSFNEFNTFIFYSTGVAHYIIKQF